MTGEDSDRIEFIDERQPVEGNSEVLLVRQRRMALVAWPWLLGAIVAAGLIGYSIGYEHKTSSATAVTTSPRASRTSASASQSSTPSVDFPTLTASGIRCSAQVGRRLQLGVEFKNDGNSAVVLMTVAPSFPLHGLQAVQTERGTCGQPSDGPIGYYSLSPGSTVWITTLVDVQIACPAALPVLFDVTYQGNDGQPRRTTLEGFGDLRDVPYTGCGS